MRQMAEVEPSLGDLPHNICKSSVYLGLVRRAVISGPDPTRAGDTKYQTTVRLKGSTRWGDRAADLGALPMEGITALDVTLDDGLCIQGETGGVACYGTLGVPRTDAVQQMDAEMGRLCTVGASGAVDCATGA